MDFDLTPELASLQQRMRALVEDDLMPHDDEIERTGKIPAGAVEALRDAGLFGLNTPSAYGGSGLSMLGTCLVYEELAHAHIAYYYLTGVNVHIGSKAIELAGTDQQKQTWLPELASGRVIGAFALTEPQAGSDAGSLQTTAVRDDSDYVLNGTKIYITNAPIAGVFTVFARTDPTSPRQAISAFIVEADAPGLRVEESAEMVGGHGATHAELTFDDCRVPAANLIGPEGSGFQTALRCLDFGRLSWGAYSVGAAERLLALTARHLVERHQFGKPLIENQGLAWQVADLYAAIHSARLVSREAAWRHDQPGADRRIGAALSKLVGAEMVFSVADRAMQLFGGAGYSKGTVERIWRDIRVVRILDGTSEIMRTVIARHVAGVAETTAT